MKSSYKKKNIFSSIKVAWQGFWNLLLKETTFKYMITIAFLVVGLMIYFPTSKVEKAILLVTIFSVLGLEMINSIIERFSNFLQPNYDPRVKEIKDLMAAFVLLVSLGAAIIGILIFFPYLKTLFYHF